MRLADILEPAKAEAKQHNLKLAIVYDRIGNAEDEPGDGHAYWGYCPVGAVSTLHPYGKHCFTVNTDGEVANAVVKFQSGNVFEMEPCCDLEGMAHVLDRSFVILPEDERIKYIKPL